MADTHITTLITRLTRYSEVLDHHNSDVQRAYDSIMDSLRGLRGIYAGDAADQFFEHWNATCDGLEEYLQGASRMKVALDAHVTELRQADTRGDAG